MNRDKRIKKFCYEEEGLFIDLEDMDSSVSVDEETGNILLDEGNGDNCYHGAVVQPKSNSCFFIIGNEVFLGFSNIQHVVGWTNNIGAAAKWVKAVNTVIAKFQEK